MESTKSINKRGVLIHLGLAIGTAIILLLITFYWILPVATNHGESLTVPNLEGILLEDLDDFLNERDLRYEVEKDSGYSSKYPALAVLQQFPLPNAKVKESRKIYVTVNAQNPPLVKIPLLKGRSLKNAQLELRSLGLALGQIKYKPDFALNTVLEQYFQGRRIEPSQEVPKGSKIDFEVGDGLGSQSFTMLDLRELDLEEATFVLRGNGLSLGQVYYRESAQLALEDEEAESEVKYYTKNVAPGKIFKQAPKAKTLTKVGQSVDLWIVQLDSTDQINQTPTLGVFEDED